MSNNSNVIKFSELQTLPDKLLRHLAVAVAHDIDNGAEDKGELLERIMVAVMSKRVGRPLDLAPDVPRPRPAVPAAIMYASQHWTDGQIRWFPRGTLPRPHLIGAALMRGIVEVVRKVVRAAFVIGVVLGMLWVVAHS